jgi:hypothetical protein
VSVVNDGVGDASHQRPPYSAETPAPHDYESGAQLLSQVDDCLIATFSDPKVGFFNTTSGPFDLFHLLVEDLLGFSLYRFERLLIGFVAPLLTVVGWVLLGKRLGDGVPATAWILTFGTLALAPVALL